MVPLLALISCILHVSILEHVAASYHVEIAVVKSGLADHTEMGLFRGLIYRYWVSSRIHMV